MSYIAAGLLEGLGKAMTGYGENQLAKQQQRQLLIDKMNSEVGIAPGSKTQSPEYLEAYRNMQGAKGMSPLEQILANIGINMMGGRMPNNDANVPPAGGGAGAGAGGFEEVKGPDGKTYLADPSGKIYDMQGNPIR